MTENVTLDDAIAAALRQVRQRHGLSQDQIAAAARDLGLGWTSQTVAAIENGYRHVSASELLLVAAIVTAVSPTPIRLTDLLLSAVEGYIKLGPDVSVLPERIYALLEGAHELGSVDLDAPLTREAGKRRASDAALVKHLSRYWPGSTIAERLTAQRDGERQAERWVAAKLQVEPDVVSTIAHCLWHRGLTEERDATVQALAEADASPRRLQALRGHVTRQRMRLIEKELQELEEGPK